MLMIVYSLTMFFVLRERERDREEYSKLLHPIIEHAMFSLSEERARFTKPRVHRNKHVIYQTVTSSRRTVCSSFEVHLALACN